MTPVRCQGDHSFFALYFEGKRGVSNLKELRGSVSSSGEIGKRLIQQTRVYPYPLVARSARPNPKMGAPDPENPLFLGFSVLKGGSRPWSRKGPDHGVGVDPEIVTNGGAKRIVRFLGGKTCHRACPPKPVLEASESGIGLVCALSLRGKWHCVNKRGGKTYHRWGGGPEPFLGRGFMVCFPLPWVFHPLLFFSDETVYVNSFFWPRLRVGSVRTTPDPDTSPKASWYKREVHVIYIGGAYTTSKFQPEEGDTLATILRYKWELHRDTRA